MVTENVKSILLVAGGQEMEMMLQFVTGSIGPKLLKLYEGYK
jgi:hypothetical protein